LASGLLGGKLTKATVFETGDHRSYNRNGERFNVGETFAGVPYEKGVELADELKALVPAGISLPDLALRWCLDFDAVTAIIPGARNPAQARSNARASSLPRLSPALPTNWSAAPSPCSSRFPVIFPVSSLTIPATFLAVPSMASWLLDFRAPRLAGLDFIFQVGPGDSPLTAQSDSLTRSRCWR
jgi:hypothetical protein